MIAWLLVAALVLVDPSGDTRGAGDLAPPTASVYESLGSLDLTAVEVLDGDPLRVRIGLASLDNPADLPNGVTLPIIEVYLETEGQEAAAGTAELLPGSGMRMPEGHAWSIALRITGDDAYAVRVDDGELRRHPVEVTREDGALWIRTPLERPDRARPYAITGVYDPFSESGWRPLAAEPSPWSFSSPQPAPPVVDVLAPDGGAQRQAIRDGRLPPPSEGLGGVPWIVLMLVGLAISGVGLALRRDDGEASPADTAPAPGSEEAPVAAGGAEATEAGAGVDDEAPETGEPDGECVEDAPRDGAAPLDAPVRGGPALAWSDDHGWFLEDPDEERDAGGYGATFEEDDVLTDDAPMDRSDESAEDDEEDAAAPPPEDDARR